MAAPIVAGAAALVHANFPELRNRKIVDQIVHTADRIPGPIEDRIDVGAALTTPPEVEPSPTPTPSPTASPTPPPTPTPTPTPSSAPILLTDTNTNRALALDSVLFTVEPFSVISLSKLNAERRTRVMLFARNVSLLTNEDFSVVTAKAVDSGNTIYPLTVEYVGALPGVDSLTVVIVKLPDNLIVNGDVSVSISVRGIVSNTVAVGIRAP
jgi:hypothetical protein